MFPSRPKSIKEEDEDDLLREQEKFITLKKAGKIEQSVTQIIRSENLKGDTTPATSPSNLENCFAEELGDLPIIERNITDFKSFSFPRPKTNAFPKPTRRTGKLFIEQSLPGKSDEDPISQSNNELLKSMGQEEIKAMQQELMSKLDPKLIDFLKNRKKRQQDKNSVSKDEIVEKRSREAQASPSSFLARTSDSTDCKKLDEFPIPLDMVKQNNWINMEIIEEDKLEWTRPPVSNDCESKNARFDFQGNLVLREASVKEGLHHHGEEPDKAGYSLAEIFTYIRSSFDSQRATGLKTLARIVEKAHKGYYDLCFNTMLSKEILDNTDIIIWVRKCLDDPSESVMREALLCLHALICNTQIDEACLDRIFSVTMHYDSFLGLQPIQEEKNTDEKELKDEQLVKIDLIKALLRFDTLQRLRYLLENNLKHCEDQTALNKVFDILIRIARHSTESCKAIVGCPYLMQCIIQNFVPTKISFEGSSQYGNPSAKALKLLRILFSNNLTCSNVLETFPDIFSSLQVYLTLDPDCFRITSSAVRRSTILHVAIEALRCWCVLLQHLPNEAKHHFNQIYPIVFRQLQYCLTLTKDSNSYDFQYASALVKCLVFSSSGETKLKEGYSSMIQSLLFQSVANEIVDMQMLPSFDAMMMMTSCVEFLISNDCKASLLSLNLLNPILENENIVKKLILELEKNSYVLNARLLLNGCQRDAVCLPSYGSIYFGGDSIKIVGILQESCALFFLESLLAVANATKSLKFLNDLIFNNWTLRYLTKLSDNYSQVGKSIFAEIEYSFIYQICISSLKITVSGEEHLFYSLALITLFNLKDVKMRENLLNLMVFNPYVLGRIMPEEDEKIIEDMERIKLMYFKYSKFENHIWPFEPIILNLRKKSLSEDISATLKFCYFLLASHNRKIIAKLLSSDVLFSLIASVFLIDDRIFAEDSIRSNLQHILQIFINENMVLVSPHEALPHFSSVLSFFDHFLDHFESESFQDPLYVNYLLFYLQTKSHPDFHKKLLSDHSICLRFMNIDLHDILLPIERLLFPPQQVPLIELYLRNLLSKSIPSTSIMYLVAVHHTHFALYRSKSDEFYEILTRCRISIEKCGDEGLKDHLKSFINSDIKKTCKWMELWNFEAKFST